MSEEIDYLAEQLATAERHIAEAERSLSEQLLRIEEMLARGEDPTPFKNVIAALDLTLVEWRAQRDLVAARLGKINTDRP